jgi:hypothetical protein
MFSTSRGSSRAARIWIVLSPMLPGRTLDSPPPLILAGLLDGMKPRLLAQALNLGSAETEGIVRFHALLIERLLASGAPE